MLFAFPSTFLYNARGKRFDIKRNLSVCLLERSAIDLEQQGGYKGMWYYFYEEAAYDSKTASPIDTIQTEALGNRELVEQERLELHDKAGPRVIKEIGAETREAPRGSKTPYRRVRVSKPGPAQQR